MTLTYWIDLAVTLAAIAIVALLAPLTRKPQRRQRKPKDWRDAIYNPREHRRPR